MARKLNSYIIHIGDGKHEKQIAVSQNDYENFNKAKGKKNYGNVCIELVRKYSTVDVNDLWKIPN